MDKREFKAGFAALIGRTNVGKSTLLNRIVGEKVSIISRKPQTTRNRITGILNGDAFQIVFLDTPGLFRPSNLQGRMMVEVAMSSMKGVDAVVFVIDALRRGLSHEEGRALSLLSGLRIPKFLVINKVDLIKKETLLPLMEDFSRREDWQAILPVSALSGDGLHGMVEEIVKVLSKGEPLFPADLVTDRTERFLAGEIVREKIYEFTHQEIPYSVMTHVEEFTEREMGDVVYLRVVVYVEKGSQKGIIIGKGGEMLKRIGQRAREEIEPFLGQKVFLDLHVKVRKGWTNDESLLSKTIY